MPKGVYKRKEPPHNFKDLSFQKFNSLFVVMPYGKTKYGNIKYLCVCDCGKVKEAGGAPSQHRSHRRGHSLRLGVPFDGS